MEKMREEFEAWYRDYEGDDEFDYFARCPYENEQYDIIRVHDAWNTWQASRAEMCVELPEGWQLVPVEPTREMIWACKERFVPRIALPIFVAAYKTMVAAAHNPTVGKQVNINPNKDNK